MLNSIVYVVVFAAALCVVAICIEQLAINRRQPRRFAWALAMLCSAVLPPLLMLKASPAPIAVPVADEIAFIQPAATTDFDRALVTTEPVTTPATSAAVLSPPQASTWQVPAPSRSSLLAAWAALSGALLTFMAGSALLLWRRSANWQRMAIQGREVLISEATGPALIGALRPQIVVPRWFMDEPADTQGLILEHEQQHIAARDPLLLRVAMLIAIAAPWNLPLWWQLRRLRLAIELDCDARVMRGGAEAARYGEVLLEVTQRAAAMPVGVIAMSEPVSALETRIRNLAPVPGRHAALRMIGALLIAVVGIGAAAALEAPAVQPAAKDPVVRTVTPAAPVAPATRATPASAATPVTPVRPAATVATAPAPARTPQPSAESSAGTETRTAPSAAPAGTPPAGYGMEMRDLIALAGKKFQKRFVVDPRIKGTVDLASLDTDSLSYHAFLEILGVHGFAAVPSGDVVTIIPAQSARTVASPIFRADNIQADDAEVVTVLIPVNGDALNMSTIVRTLVGQAGQIVAMPDGKTLLVVDTAGNVKRIAAVVQAVSKPQ